MAASAPPASSDLQSYHDTAIAYFRQARYVEAARAWKAAVERADEQHRPAMALRMMNNLAGCYFASYRYGEALAGFLEIRRRARAVGDQEMAGVSSVNLSSLYMILLEPDAAWESLEQAERALPAASRYWPRLLAQKSHLLAASRDDADALRAGMGAAHQADQAGDLALVAQMWDRLARLEMDRGRLEQAEEFAVEAFRLRLLLRAGRLESSYRTLSRLRLMQGKPADALLMAERAEQAHQFSPGMTPGWSRLYERGTILEANGRLPEALSAFDAALADARRWRTDWLGGQWALQASDVNHSVLASRFASLAGRLALHGGRSGLAVKALSALEEGRAKGLRETALLAALRQSRLPAEYGETVAQLRALQASVVSGSSGLALRKVPALRGRLAEMEAEAGLGAGESQRRPGELPDAAAWIRQARPDEALFSFLLREEGSWLWTVTREGVHCHALPGAAVIRGQVRAFQEALRGNGGDQAWDAGNRLSSTLFGSLTGDVLTRRKWVLSVDAEIYALPFAALPLRPAGRSRRYLVESHTLKLVPSLLLLEEGEPAGPASGFAGMGDPIYNLADPRRPQPPPFAWLGFGAARSTQPAGLALPRLPGSGREVARIARLVSARGEEAWTLTGADATVAGVETLLAKKPRVLHLAAHIFPSPAPAGRELALHAISARGGHLYIMLPDEVFVALSLGSDNHPELLSSTVVSRRFRAPGSLVVLSGCESAAGPVLPGAGLQGMTSSWLAAGASAVLGSLWIQPDDAGLFFDAFYRNLRPGTDPESALQAAQTAMIRNAGWRADPRFWSAWILVGRRHA